MAAKKRASRTARKTSAPKKAPKKKARKKRAASSATLAARVTAVERKVSTLDNRTLQFGSTLTRLIGVTKKLHGRRAPSLKKLMKGPLAAFPSGPHAHYSDLTSLAGGE